MTLIEGVRAYLLGQPDLVAIVGTQIYPVRLPQDVHLTTTVGAVQLARVGQTRGGQLRGPNALAQALLQLDAWAGTYDLAMTISILCRQRLSGFRGTWVDDGSPATALTVQGLRVEDERDFSEAEVLAPLGRISTDYFISYVVHEPLLI